MVLLSGRGSNFMAIHDAIRDGRIDAEIVLVFSNKEDAPGLRIARERGLETLYLNPSSIPEKEEYDREIVREARKRERGPHLPRRLHESPHARCSAGNSGTGS